MAGVPSGITFQTIAKTVASPGTAERVSAFYVREGQVVSVTARISNAANMYVAETQAKAQSGARKLFVPGQSRDYYIDNTARLWVDADNATDVLEVSIESDTSGSNPA